MASQHFSLSAAIVKVAQRFTFVCLGFFVILYFVILSYDDQAKVDFCFFVAVLLLLLLLLLLSFLLASKYGSWHGRSAVSIRGVWPGGT